MTDGNGNIVYVDEKGNEVKVGTEEKTETKQLGYSLLMLNGSKFKLNSSDIGFACFANTAPDKEILDVKYYKLGMLNADGDIEYKAYTFQEQKIDENGCKSLTGE